MWNDVLGHHQQKEFLKKYLYADNRPHAILFAGMEGIGKKKIVLEFAKALLCSNHTGEDNCASCRLLNLVDGNFSHPDFLLIRREQDEKTGRFKDINIEQIKNLISKSAFAPVMSNTKVCIIEDIDRISEAAANSFLKLLEEPPVEWIFLLIATDVEKILPTILSRVICLHFYSLPLNLTEQYLVNKDIAAKQAAVLAAVSEGSIGVALDLYQQDFLTWREQAKVFLEALPLTSSENYLTGRIWQQKDFERKRALLLVKVLCLLVRDLLLCKLGLEKQLYNCDIIDDIYIMSKNWSIKSLKASLIVIQDAYVAIDNNAGIRLVLEAMALKIDKIYKDKE